MIIQLEMDVLDAGILGDIITLGAIKCSDKFKTEIAKNYVYILASDLNKQINNQIGDTKDDA